jgi:hypothetical protein
MISTRPFTLVQGFSRKRKPEATLSSVVPEGHVGVGSKPLDAISPLASGTGASASSIVENHALPLGGTSVDAATIEQRVIPKTQSVVAGEITAAADELVADAPSRLESPSVVAERATSGSRPMGVLVEIGLR